MVRAILFWGNLNPVDIIAFKKACFDLKGCVGINNIKNSKLISLNFLLFKNSNIASSKTELDFDNFLLLRKSTLAPQFLEILEIFSESVLTKI